MNRSGIKGEVVGWVTSGGYAHYVQKSVALGYVPKEIAAADDGFEIEIIGKRYPAQAAARTAIRSFRQPDARLTDGCAQPIP